MRFCYLNSNKIKSRLKKGGQYKSNLLKNYFVAWIANLGVVPLFLFAAFLLAPAFFFFLNLLLLVTHVLETIRQLLYRYRTNVQHFNDFKPSFVPRNSLCVKGLFTCLALMLLISHKSYAEITTHDVILARGESNELDLKEMEKFNVGNRQVLSYQLNEKYKKLLIRGAQLGHSEILVWNKDKSLTSYKISVISKIQEAKFLNLAQILLQLGLNPTTNIPHIQVSGELEKLSNYLNYKKILEQNKDILMDETRINAGLKNYLFAEVYTSFFDDFKDSIRCKADFSEVSCYYPENDSPSESLKKFLAEKYKIVFIQESYQQKKKNYHLKLKLIQLEQLDGEDLRLGLEQMSGSLGDFFKLPIENIVKQNQVLLTQKKVKLSTLAEPQSLIRAQTPVELQMGSDIPFKNINSNNNQTTDWKFAGLKIKIDLENFGDLLKLNFDTELTQPTSDSQGNTSISGNKEKSSVVLKLGEATKIFQISLKTEGKSIDQLPFLNAIPLLGELFKSKSNQSNYKTITGIIEVSENE